MESVTRYTIAELRFGGNEAHNVKYISEVDYDLLKAENASLEQRRHAEQQACQAAERQVGELEALLIEALKAWELIQYGDPPVELAKVMARARAALNPTAEAESHDEPQCLRCLDRKTVPGKIPGGFVQDCPDCCGEEG